MYLLADNLSSSPFYLFIFRFARSFIRSFALFSGQFCPFLFAVCCTLTIHKLYAQHIHLLFLFLDRYIFVCSMFDDRMHSILDILSVVSGMFSFFYSYSIPQKVSSFTVCTLFIYLWNKWIRSFENSVSLNWLAVLPKTRSICIVSVQCPVSSVRVSCKQCRLYKHEVSNNLSFNHVWAGKT